MNEGLTVSDAVLNNFHSDFHEPTRASSSVSDTDIMLIFLSQSYESYFPPLSLPLTRMKARFQFSKTTCLTYQSDL